VIEGQLDYLSGIPAFETLMSLVAQNIQVTPEVKLDEKGFAHRVQNFETPELRPRVLFSKRALVRYKCQFDVLNGALVKKSAESLCAGACLLLGKELLLTNRFAGAAFIAHAFEKLRATYMREDHVFEHMLQGLRENEQGALINFFLPLAHEIGHLERSQALAPADIHSEKFFDTYRINYERIWPIIGDLDYVGSQKNDQSPLFLPLLREEVISDWFAVCAVFAVICKTTKNGEFELLSDFSNLIMFPLVAAFEATCLKEWPSTHFVQEVLLATQCRYSLLIDSMRATAKSIFPKNHAEIDGAITEIVKLYKESLGLIWDCAIQLNSLIRELMRLSDAEVAKYIGDRTSSAQWMPLHSYLLDVLEDSKGYALFESNRIALRRALNSMVNFETVIMTDNGFIAIPKRSDAS
jgi:hypothetical protein